MNKNNIEKFKEYLKNPKIVVSLVIYIVLLAIFYYLSSNARQEKKKLINDLNFKENEVKNLTSPKKKVPTYKEVQWMKNRYEKLEKIYSDVLFALRSRQKDVSVLKPLEFKDELVQTQNEFEKNYPNLTFPKGFGFKEYIEEMVPKEKDLPDLTKELYIIKDIIKELATVGRGRKSFNILNIERKKEEDIFMNKLKNKKFFKVFSVYFKVEANFMDLFTFFRNLAYSDEHFFLIDNIKIEFVNEDRIESEFIIRSVEFY